MMITLNVLISNTGLYFFILAENLKTLLLNIFRLKINLKSNYSFYNQIKKSAYSFNVLFD